MVCLTVFVCQPLAHAQVICEGADTSEDFSRETMGDGTSVDGWGVNNEPISIPKKGILVGSNGRLGARLQALAAFDDVDGDGFADLVGVIDDGHACWVQILRNLGLQSDGSHAGFDVGEVGGGTQSLGQVPCDVPGMILLSGDVDADGDRDVLFMHQSSSEQMLGDGLVAGGYVFEDQGALGWRFHDVTDDLVRAGLSWHATGQQALLHDMSANGRADLVMATGSGANSSIVIVHARGETIGFSNAEMLLADTEVARPVASDAQSADWRDRDCPPDVTVGVTALALEDLDGDGNDELITGSASEAVLRVWGKNAAGDYERVATVPFDPGAPAFIMALDADGDGDLDLAVARSGLHCNGSGGKVWLLVNEGSGWQFDLSEAAIGNAGREIGYAVAAYIDDDLRDTGVYQRLDIMFGRDHPVGSYRLLRQTEGDLYNIRAVANSQVIADLRDLIGDDTKGIVSVDVTGFSYQVDDTTNVELWVSNNDGANWEKLTDEEMRVDGPEHSFVNFGSILRWRLVLTADAAELTTAEMLYDPAARTTPTVSFISLRYFFIGEELYSRSHPEQGTVVDADGNTLELLFTARFGYPSFKGTLVARDLAGIMVGTGGEDSDQISTLDNVWEAGEILVGNESRTLYYAFANTTDGDGVVDDRALFSKERLVSDAGTPPLSQLMGVGALNNSERRKLMDYLTGSMTDPDGWKLKDMGHSSPVFVAAPSGDASYLGDGYDLFQQDNDDRRPMVYMGGNDGFLHAFDVLTGAEDWGLVPYNLLSKVKRQIADPTTAGTSIAQYQHNAFVDGAVVVSDVYDFVGQAWHTVAYVAQATGQGGDDKNHYFAIDITDADGTPRPLWEFADDVALVRACSGDPCTVSTQPVCEPIVCSDYCTLGTPAFSPGPGGVVMEAEHPSENEQNAARDAWRVRNNGGGVADADGDRPVEDYLLAELQRATSCIGDLDRCGARVRYAFELNATGNYRLYVRLRAGDGTRDDDNDTFVWSLDDGTQTVFDATSLGEWVWNRIADTNISGGEHYLDLWIGEPDLMLDRIVITDALTPPADDVAETCTEVCEPEVCTAGSNVLQCLAAPEEEDWPECGTYYDAERDAERGLKCCTFAEEHFCSFTDEPCAAPPAVLGETWSPPVVGKVHVNAVDRWVTFFASGYDNRSSLNVGRSLYAVDALTGEQYARWDFPDIPYDADVNPSTIENTVPGGASVADLDGDGFLDRLYIGDLEGRLWKVDLSEPGTTDSETLQVAQWPACVLFDAGDPNGDGRRTWAPIITKPAIALLATNSANVYFGTGGDDDVPSSISHRFYSVRDDDAPGTCRDSPKEEDDLDLGVSQEWFVGDPTAEDDTTGLRYWSDPVVVDAVVYFAALTGKIESVNVCENLRGEGEEAGGSRLFGVATMNFRAADGRFIRVGESVFSQSSMTLNVKLRQSVLVRGRSSEPVARPQAQENQGATDIIAQGYTGDAQFIGEAHPGIQVSSKVRVMRWREIPL